MNFRDILNRFRAWRGPTVEQSVTTAMEGSVTRLQDPAERSAYLDLANTAPIETSDPRYREYTRLWNAISVAVYEEFSEQGYAQPRFSERKRIANQVWRELHP